VTQSAILALEDGTVFEGDSVGAPGLAVGEVVFNTAMTGYQEIVTDPSYARQLVTLTCPHVGNTGCNPADDESRQAWAAGLIVRDVPRRPSNWRSAIALPEWLRQRGVVAISGIDTRKLTRLLRDRGAQNGALVAADEASGTRIDVDAAIEAARKFPGLKGMDLAKEVCVREPYRWNEGRLDLDRNAFGRGGGRFRVVAYDFGVKTNILRMLAERGCDLTVVPAQTPASEVFPLQPDGVFLGNGPGDPAPCDYDRGDPRVHRPQAAAVRHLPGPPDPRSRARREDGEDEVRPPRREPSGHRPRQRARADHQPEPRFRRGRGDAAGQRARHPPLAVRRFQPGHRAVRRAGLQLPGPSGSQPGPARRRLSLRPLHRVDAGRARTRNARGGALTCRSAQTSRPS
jgi:carbamoyl-phosphate synthase small subunit